MAVSTVSVSSGQLIKVYDALTLPVQIWIFCDGNNRHYGFIWDAKRSQGNWEKRYVDRNLKATKRSGYMYTIIFNSSYFFFFVKLKKKSSANYLKDFSWKVNFTIKTDRILFNLFWNSLCCAKFNLDVTAKTGCQAWNRHHVWFRWLHAVNHS